MEKIVFITGPNPTIELAYSDVWLPGLYSRRILCFELPPNSSHEDATKSLEKAMKALVEGTPELGGTCVVVHNAAPHDSTKPWRAIAPGDGIQLVIKDMTKSFQSYKELENSGFPISAFKDSLFMPIDVAIKPEPQPQALFQLSLIDGGALLSVCIYHHFTDGNGMNIITRALGDECKKASEATGELAPRVLDSDREIFSSLNGGITDIEEHPAYSMVEGIFTPGAQHEEAPPEANGEPAPPPPEFVPAFFHITDAKAKALKEYASRDMPVSTHDAISATLWRTLILSRFKTGQLTEDTKTTFTVPHNARKHLGLADEWVGNCVYFISADAKVTDVIKEDSIPNLAAKIRTELNKTNRERVEGMMTLRKKAPYDLAWWPIGVCNEPHICGITSMYHSKIAGHDFGPALGKVKHFTSTDIGAFGSAFQRAGFVGPKLDTSRACNVHVGLIKKEVEPFFTDLVWSKYFSPLEVRGNHVNGI